MIWGIYSGIVGVLYWILWPHLSFKPYCRSPVTWSHPPCFTFQQSSEVILPHLLDFSLFRQQGLVLTLYTKPQLCASSFHFTFFFCSLGNLEFFKSAIPHLTSSSSFVSCTTFFTSLFTLLYNSYHALSVFSPRALLYTHLFSCLTPPSTFSLHHPIAFSVSSSWFSLPP